MRIGLKDSEQINCEKVWDAFKETFAFKGPCEATTNDYLAFLDKIEEDIPKDKVMLRGPTCLYSILHLEECL